MIRAALFASLIAAPALARGPLLCVGGRVIDADTFDVSCVIDGRIVPDRIRLAQVDAPERGGCDAQRATRRAGTELVGTLVPDRILIVSPEQGRSHDRLVARVRVGGRDLSDALVARGLAKEWPHDGQNEPGRRKPRWCGASGAP